MAHKGGLYGKFNKGVLANMRDGVLYVESYMYS